MRFRRGKRVSPIAIGYESTCGLYRVDAVKYGPIRYWRAMIRHGGRWDVLNRIRYRSRVNAEYACVDHAALPDCCKAVDFAPA